MSYRLTDKDAGDPDQIDDILAQIGSPVGLFMANGAYDGNPVYDAVRCHSPDLRSEVVIPPRKTAVLSREDKREYTERERHILELAAKGRIAWQKAHDYGRRSLVETTMGRYKSIIGDRLHARHDDAQAVEVGDRINRSHRHRKDASCDSHRPGLHPRRQARPVLQCHRSGQQARGRGPCRPPGQDGR